MDAQYSVSDGDQHQERRTMYHSYSKIRSAMVSHHVIEEHCEQGSRQH